MKLKAIAKFERNPRVRLSSGLIPSERSCASSRSAWSWTESATISSSYLHAGARREPDLWKMERVDAREWRPSLRQLAAIEDRPADSPMQRDLAAADQAAAEFLGLGLQ